MFAWLNSLPPLFADDVPLTTPYWYGNSFAMALLSTIAFGGVGIVMSILGFKLFDWLTPGNLQEEIFQKQNIAAAVLGAAVVIGICIVR
ncbi:MAG: DUF350 domain-containing protein [Gemmataceae bacterium]|nr:DUF350 domain-containing protein [Gemmataceae bacterium]